MEFIKKFCIFVQGLIKREYRMRKHNTITLIFLISFILVAFRSINKVVQYELEVITKDVKLEETLEFLIPDFEINELDLFLDEVGFQESTNRYDVVNRYGYMGKYQFGKSTLKNLGYDVSKKEFLNSPELQEKAMLDLLYHNKEILEEYIEHWDGRKIDGVVVTESGILAAAHLVGPSRVKRYFKKGEVSSDRNGTKLTTYLKKFSGYKLNLD